MLTEKETNHIYVIKQRRRIDLDGRPFEYDELVGKCTSSEEARKIVDATPDTYISDDAVYTVGDFFRHL